MNRRIQGMLSLSPLLFFLTVYFVSSIAAGDFYRVPISSAFLLACIYALFIVRREDGTRLKVRERIDIFSRGAGDSNVLLMIWIFILAGAFAGTAKDMGSIDATVNATLSFMPPKMLYAGLFLTACFISMAIGTSVGTIVALVPIGTGIAAESGTSAAFMAGIIVGGAFFGDNLSFISDTTIAATRAVGCEMRDKFKANVLIILPAVIIVTVIYLLKGQETSVLAPAEVVDWLKLLPYLLVIALAVTGMNVALILTIGLAANAVIGLATGSFTWLTLLDSAGKGIAGMSDLIIITMLAGGLLEMIRESGGLDYIINGLTRRISGRRGAQASIALLVSLANICTANNTIAIITTGRIASDISGKFDIDPRKSASILDTFSCLIQGIIPYGAQILMASGLASIAPTSIIPQLYYPFLMGICAMLAIVFDFPRFSRKS